MENCNMHEKPLSFDGHFSAIVRLAKLLCLYYVSVMALLLLDCWLIIIIIVKIIIIIKWLLSFQIC